MNKSFYTFALPSNSSFFAARTLEYARPTHAKRAVFEVGKTYRIKCQYKTDSSVEYEVLITSICEKYIEADYLTLIENGNEEPLEGAFFLSEILEVVEIESWAKYYTYCGDDCFKGGASCGYYLMKKSNGMWATYDKLGTGRLHNKEDGETYDGFAKRGVWVETTPEKAFGRH
jgi:hypothetical protein